MSNPWIAKVLTLFPEMFPGPLGHSLAGRGMANNLWRMEAVQIRDFATDKHRTVDDSPFGGGAGMVMRADVLDAALEATIETGLAPIVMTPRGRMLDQDRVRKLAAGPGVVVLCGRFEGIDQRVIEARGLEEVSVGDFVLSGGETAALTLIDACVRLIPGVMGSEATLDEESFEEGLLEYPHFTRPADWNGRPVPDILLSGHHERIRAWRLAEARRITADRRPDLWARYCTRHGAGSH